MSGIPILSQSTKKQNGIHAPYRNLIRINLGKETANLLKSRDAKSQTYRVRVYEPSPYPRVAAPPLAL